MKKKILVRGPALSQSGYGEHTRYVLRALRRQEDNLDIHVMATAWGETGWLAIDDEERRWLDGRIAAAAEYVKTKQPYDISVQVTIPNEWQRIAPINIGVTAGIECNKVSPVWLEKANEMDKVITISKHSAEGFTKTSYEGVNSVTGQAMTLTCTTPVEVVGYPVKATQAPENPILDLDYDFNYLAVAQWGPRKNLHNLVKWFVEENIDQEVGLVLKTSLKNNSVVDREHVESVISSILAPYPERKCKVYLLHGDMTEEEIHSLYIHPKIKAMLSLTHGEGFGLPLFEAAYNTMPIIAPGWSGQSDFLYTPFESRTKKKKQKAKAQFAEVDYTIGPVPAEAVWQGVIEKDTMWAFPSEGSFKMRLRQVRRNYDKWLGKAGLLCAWVREEFESEKMHEKLSQAIHDSNSMLDVDEMFNKLMASADESPSP